jgi:hypothetical protein
MEMDILTAFGLFAVSAMLVCYALADYSPWFVLAFAGLCAFCCACGSMQGDGPSALWKLSGPWLPCGAGVSSMLLTNSRRSPAPI